MFALSFTSYAQGDCEACVVNGGFYCGDDPANWTSYAPEGCVPDYYINDGWEDCVDASDENGAEPTADCGGGGGDCEVDEDEDGICDDVDDCVGAYDDCGVCNGDGSSCGGECELPNELLGMIVGGGSWDSEISWNIEDADGGLVAEGAAGEFLVCLNPASCYTLNMLDSYGDGWNGATADIDMFGSFTLAEGSEGSEQIGDCGGGGGDIIGCTYEIASNYNDLATSDDGSCLFDDCDPNAGYDEGYNAGVESVDCPDVSSCPSDLNGDGTITTGDLLVFLGAFGTICE